jgi:hypothetical protein
MFSAYGRLLLQFVHETVDRFVEVVWGFEKTWRESATFVIDGLVFDVQVPDVRSNYACEVVSFFVVLAQI